MGAGTSYSDSASLFEERVVRTTLRIAYTFCSRLRFHFDNICLITDLWYKQIHSIENRGRSFDRGYAYNFLTILVTV